MTMHINKGCYIIDTVLKHRIAQEVIDKVNKKIINLDINPLKLEAYARIDDVDTPFVCREPPTTDSEAMDLIHEAWIPISFKKGSQRNEMFVVELHAIWQDGKLKKIKYPDSNIFLKALQDSNEWLQHTYEMTPHVSADCKDPLSHALSVRIQQEIQPITLSETLRIMYYAAMICLILYLVGYLLDIAPY